MALDYRKCAEEIFANLGGKDNIISAAHCATRLRLVIADNSKVNSKALEDVEGVKGMFESNGQLQLIIGTGTVNKVYDEFLAVTGLTAATKAEVKEAAASKMPWWKKILKTPGDIFVPILPAIVASGLMMGLVEALGKAIPSFADTGWYSFLDMAANTAFALLPVLVAISAARVFGGNIFLGAVIGIMMVHPALLNAWNAGSVQNVASNFGKEIPVDAFNNALTALKPEVAEQIPSEIMTYLNGLIANKQNVSAAFINGLPGSVSSALWGTLNTSLSVADIGGIPKWDLLGSIGITRVGYQGHVIPVILAVLLMSKVESFLHKKVPEMIDLFVTPLVTVLVTAFATFLVIGPIFSVLENWVLAGAKWLVTSTGGIGALVMGALYPWTVVMGLHHMYNVIEAGMLAAGDKNIWMPIASSANFAQFGACLACFFIAKNRKTKAVALPASLSAALGITEPAIFGINFRFMKPFIAAVIGGAVASLFGALTKLGATAYGVTGIPGLLIIDNIPLYAIQMLIACGVAFILTFVLWKEDKPEEKKAAEPPKNLPTASVIRIPNGEVIQPVPGKVIPREEIPDETFATGVLGDGVGIVPAEGVVYAPFDGEIASIFDTNHAVSLEGKGMELLIHVGVDTVNMKGDGFKGFVQTGDMVKAGQKLIEFDIEKIKKAGYSPVTAVLLTNSEDIEGYEVGVK
ncbi:MAG: PTS glucose transporter subunit IIA [Oscillospiraceae bacterium]|nr:PTS glucose transporter subunit IIA [Oscillospiraceae bacterium]